MTRASPSLAIVEHQLAVVLLNERSGQRCVAGAQGLHLVTDQDYPGLVRLQNRVVMPGPPIRGDGPAACVPGRGDLLVKPGCPPGGAGQAPAELTDLGTVSGKRPGELLCPPR